MIGHLEIQLFMRPQQIQTLLINISILERNLITESMGLIGIILLHL